VAANGKNGKNGKNGNGRKAAGRGSAGRGSTDGGSRSTAEALDRTAVVAAPDGRPALGDRKIRVAIVGVGNCASSLVQGRYYYENAAEGDFVPGLMHVSLGGYHVRDIEFVAAFDINREKVGRDLSEAIYARPNNTIVFQQVQHLGVPVERGMTHDGLGKYLSQVIEKAPGPTADIVGILRDRKVDVMVSYLPVGSEEATKWYAEQAIKAGVGFVNAIPVFIGREPYWQRRFAEEGLPIIGDDIKSQVGATITHRVLTRLFMDRGVRLDRTYQLNFGGNTDFLNMLERERLESKKISKTNAVTSMLDYDVDADNVHVGPSDHVPWLTDRKFCYIQMEGTTFGNVPLRAEIKLEVWDSPNSAGVITDAIRCLKLGLDRGLAGTLVAPSSYFMKSPPIQIADDISRERVEAFIRGEDNEVLDGSDANVHAAIRTTRQTTPKPRATRAPAKPVPAKADSAPAKAARPRAGAAARGRAANERS
jgi:myo-inositol-1-phosphate synthase